MKYEITKEQIKWLYDNQSSISSIKSNLEQWFPEAFEVELEAKKWYKSSLGNLVNYQGNKDGVCYGFGYETKNWIDSMTFVFIYHPTNSKITWELATDQEVEAALIAEAKKRGFKEGVYISPIHGYYYGMENDLKIINSEPYFKEGALCMKSKGYNSAIFKDGVWAEIIPTLTLKEAEKKLGVKIIS